MTLQHGARVGEPSSSQIPTQRLVFVVQHVCRQGKKKKGPRAPVKLRQICISELIPVQGNGRVWPHVRVSVSIIFPYKCIVRTSSPTSK